VVMREGRDYGDLISPVHQFLENRSVDGHQGATIGIPVEHNDQDFHLQIRA